MPATSEDFLQWIDQMVWVQTEVSISELSVQFSIISRLVLYTIFIRTLRLLKTLCTLGSQKAVWGPRNTAHDISLNFSHVTRWCTGRVFEINCDKRWNIFYKKIRYWKNNTNADAHKLLDQTQMFKQTFTNRNIMATVSWDQKRVARSVIGSRDSDQCKYVQSDIMSPVERHWEQKYANAVFGNYFDSRQRTTAFCCSNLTASCNVLMENVKWTTVQPRFGAKWLSPFLTAEDRMLGILILHKRTLWISILERFRQHFMNGVLKNSCTRMTNVHQKEDDDYRFLGL